MSVQPPGDAAAPVDVAISAWLPPGYDADEVWDGTDVGSWRNRVDVLLEALFPLEGGQRPGPTLTDWLTEAPSVSGE